jgi:RHS repeat-associated protein
LITGGVSWSYSYTSKNDVNLATNPLGRVTDHDYNSAGNLTEVIEKDNSSNVKRRTCFTVDSAGLISEKIESTTLTDCTGNKTKYEYNSNGYVTGIIDARFSGQGTPPKDVLTYDDGGRKLTQTNELSHTTTWTYDDANHVLTVTDHLSNGVSYTYDAAGNAKTVTNANRKANGTAESGTNCGTAATGNGVDNDSDGAIDDGCPSTIYNYDNANRLTSVIDALGNTTAYAYDGNSNRTGVTDAKRQAIGASETGTECTAGFNKGKDDDNDDRIDDGCPNVTYTYDALNRVATVVDDLGTTTLTYDAASNLTGRNVSGQTTSYTYDAARRLTFVNYPSGTADVTYTYNAVHNRTEMADGTGTTTYAYDALNRVTSVTFPGPKTVSYTYDNPGNRSRITYPDSKYVDYGYDAANNLTSVTDWLSKVTTYTYNNAGMLTTTTLPASTGVTSTRGYDNADRLTSIVNAQGQTTLSSFTYTLNPAGNRTQMVDQAGTNSYTYDPLHRLKSVTYPDPATDNYGYDAVGNRLTKNVNTVSSHGLADQLLSVTTQAAAIEDWETGRENGGGGWSDDWSIVGDSQIYIRSSDGPKGKYHLKCDHGTVTATRTVNIAGVSNPRLKFWSKGAWSGTKINKAQVSTDGTNWTDLQTVNEDVNYTLYDLDLSAFAGATALRVRFVCAVDDEDHWWLDDISVVSSSAVTTVFTYDSRGNQTARGADTFTWDNENRMTSATIGSVSSTYLYDGDGLRVSRTAGGNIVNYLLDVITHNPVVLHDGTNTYVYGLGLISMTDSNGTQTYRLSDGLGSTMTLVDASGNVTGTYVYDVFGSTRTHTGNSAEFTFTGEQVDPSGLEYLRIRYYDPAIGRFISRDPFPPSAREPLTLNRYAYVHNNPVNLTDPSGLGTGNGSAGIIKLELVGTVGIGRGGIGPSGVGRLAKGTAAVAAVGVIVYAADSLRESEDDNDSNNDSSSAPTISDHVAGQLDQRGWTEDSIADTIKNGTALPTTDHRHMTDGTQRNDPATGYVNPDGSYVVINDVTNEVIAVSDRTDPDWQPPADLQLPPP